MTGEVMRKACVLMLGAWALAAATTDAAGATLRIVIKAASYDPQQVRARVGDTIEWDNQDIVAHTASAADKAWNVSLAPGRTARAVMQAPGTIGYTCRYHPNMKGEIVVEP